MGSRFASEVVGLARQRLQDTDNVVRRWTDEELLANLNEGELAIVNIKPDAYTGRLVIDVANKSWIPLPDNAHGLIEITRNMGNDGQTPGARITKVSRDVLDVSFPNWESSLGFEAEHYVFDDMDERYFGLWPRVLPTGLTEDEFGSQLPVYVEGNFTLIPRAVVLNEAINIPDTYVPALTDYVVYRALNSDLTGNAGNRDLSQLFYNQFLAALTGKSMAELQVVKRGYGTV